MLTVSLVLGLSSRYIAYVHKTSVAGPLSAPLIPLPGVSRVINSLLSYLLHRQLKPTETYRSVTLWLLRELANGPTTSKSNSPPSTEP